MEFTYSDVGIHPFKAESTSIFLRRDIQTISKLLRFLGFLWDSSRVPSAFRAALLDAEMLQHRDGSKSLPRSLGTFAASSRALPS